jgi:hypothetical protein
MLFLIGEKMKTNRKKLELNSNSYINYHILLFLLNNNNADHPQIDQLFKDEISDLSQNLFGIKLQIDLELINQQISKKIEEREIKKDPAFVKKKFWQFWK